MRTTPLPDWIGSSTVDVCRTCHIFWIDGGSFNEIPKGSQLLHERGDSTLVKDLGEAYLEYNKNKMQQENGNHDGVIHQPDSFWENIVTFLGLPIERSNRAEPEWPVVSGFILAVMLVLQIFFTDAEAIAQFGFYPNEPFKNWGFNLFSSVFLHSGWFHFLVNSYFAFILSDDVEDDLGRKKYFFFLAFVIVTGGLIQIPIAGNSDLPHIGYSGVVMALFAYYGLQFPKAKLIWLLPRISLMQFDKVYVPMIGRSWYQFRALWVALFYFTADLIYYLLLEKGDQSQVSYSGHIVGFLAGSLFWKIFANKTFQKTTQDIFDKHLDRVMPKDINEQKQLPNPNQRLIE